MWRIEFMKRVYLQYFPHTFHLQADKCSCVWINKFKRLKTLIIYRCTDLQRLSPFANLQSLTLRKCKNITSAFFTILKDFNALRILDLECCTLSCYDLSMLEQISCIQLCNIDTTAILQIPSSLTHFAFNSAGVIPNFADCMNLKRLDLTNSNEVSDETLSSLLHCKKIEILQIGGFTDVTSEGLRHVFTLNNLKSIEINEELKIDLELMMKEQNRTFDIVVYENENNGHYEESVEEED